MKREQKELNSIDKMMRKKAVINDRNKQLKKYKLKQSGITLIALVVTIVVLLVLAGITISMVSNDGIIGKAKNAAAVSAESSAEEEF